MNFKIKTKNGIQLATKGKGLVEDIIVTVDSSLLGGGDSAIVVSPVEWFGTAVPNTGFVENLYFNTNLSIDEVNEILDNLDFANSSELTLIRNNGQDVQIDCFNVGIYSEGEAPGYILSSYSYNDGRKIIFNSSTQEAPQYIYDVASNVGWNSEFSGIYPFNDDAMSMYWSTVYGEQNYKISSVFSLTPFSKQEGLTEVLSGTYNGATTKVNIDPYWIGTTVPNTGFVKEVYFNTELKRDEVFNYIKKNFTSNSGADMLYYYNNETGEEITISMWYTSYGGDYIYIDVYTNNGFRGRAYSSRQETDEISGKQFTGWNPSLPNPLPINVEVMLDGNNGAVGDKNSMLSSIFSITPFELKDGATIELKPYIDNKKIPLYFKVEYTKKEDSLLKLINTTKSCGSLYRNYQNNYGDPLEPLISGDDTKDVEYFDHMYENCYADGNFPMLNTSNGIDFSYMYYSCWANEFPLLDTQNGTNFSYMYSDVGTNAESLPLINTSKGKNFTGMYKHVRSEIPLPQIDTSEGDIFTSMYEGNTNAGELFPELNCQYGTDFSRMYANCPNMWSFPMINTESGVNFSEMYMGCARSNSFPALNTANGEDFTRMFDGCKYVFRFPAINVSKAKSLKDMYQGCNKATDILMYGMKIDFEIPSSLSISSTVVVLSNCQVVTTNPIIKVFSRTLTELENTYVKETGVEQYSGITCRPCVICESTDEGAMSAIDYIKGKGWTIQS